MSNYTIPMPYPKFTYPLNPAGQTIQRCPVSRQEASHRILIMRLASNGDLLMATPLLAALRHNYPSAYITWMVERSATEAIDASPYIDEVLVWDGSYWRNFLRRLLHICWIFQALRFLTQMRRRKFDIFISFHAEKWPSLSWASGAQKRIGVHNMFPQFDKPHPEYRRHYTTFYDRPHLPLHHTDIYLLPLKALGLISTKKKMSLGYTESDVNTVDAFLSKKQRNTIKPLVVIAPQTTWQTRCWSEDRYALLGDALQVRGYEVIVIGSPAETTSVEKVAAKMHTRPITAAGQLSFRQVAALISRSALVVSGDTGPMHMAAAVGTPYVALFGATPVRGRAPLVGSGVSLAKPVPCGPCDFSICHNEGANHMLCMKLLTVDEVLAAVNSLLA